MSHLKELIRDYRESCSVPKHPKKCPDCGSKVGVFHLNFEEAVWMCSNAECIWPLVTHSPSQILGKSDVTKFVRIKLEKRKLKLDESTSDELSKSESEESPVKKSRKDFLASRVNIIEETAWPESDELSQSENVTNLVKKPRNFVQANTKSYHVNDSAGPSCHGQTRCDNVQMLQNSSFSTKETSQMGKAFNVASPPKQQPSSANQPPEVEAPNSNIDKSAEIDDGDECTTPFHFPSFDVPRMLSPLAPSPAHSLFKSPSRMSTPLRDDDEDGFAGPSSVMSSSKITTPFHVPQMISPLRMTPRRGSERSVGNIDEDFNLTDSEVSDVERTPRRSKPDMPFLGSPSGPRHNYSKDLSALPPPLNGLLSTSDEGSSPVKMLLKRNSGNEWNVEENEDVVLPDRPALSGKQPIKLDKVVLNLKKSVTGNTWNVTEKKQVEVEATSEVILPPKEERRGRKSKVAPMKIQNVEEIPNISLMPSDPTSESQDLQLPSKSLPDLEEPCRKSAQPLPAPTEEVLDLQLPNKPLPSRDEPCQKSAQPLPAPTVECFDLQLPSKPLPKLSDPIPKPARLSPPREAAIDGCISSTGVRVTKTFARKKKTANSQLQQTPGNHQLPHLRLMDHHEEALNNNLNLDTDWKEVAELSSKAANAFRRTESFHEFSQLMKAATGENDIDLGFVQKIQKKLSLKNVSRGSQVTFFVGQSKTSIDLPTDDTSMPVSDCNSAIQIMLSSQSDGIIGDVLKVKDPVPQLMVEQKKRGRPVKPRLPSPPPTMVPPQPVLTRHDPNFTGFDDLLNNPAAIQRFKHHLSVLMQGYELPPEWAAYNIDPFVAMMATRAQDPAYASINFEAMLQLYAKIVNYEWMMQSQQHFGGANAYAETDASVESQQLNQGGNEQQNDDRTYAELQTVRSSDGVKDATQVLRQHHQQQQQQTAEPPIDANTSKRLVIKQEAMTPMQPQPLDGSVSVLSVRPAPPSVSVVPKHMASQMEGAKGKIGSGNMVVSFTYSKCNFGPIYASSDEEVKAIVALVQAKVEEREYRDLHGGRKSNGVYESTAAIRARSCLSKDVVQYLEKAFTKRGMKENVVGRKRRNYPKRSAIIKQDPVTGQLYYPNGQLVEREPVVKTEAPPIIENTPAPSLDLASLSGATPRYCPPSPVTVNIIDDIICNTESSQAEAMGSSSDPDQVKISQSLFGKKKILTPVADPSTLRSVAVRGQATYSKTDPMSEPLSKEETAADEKLQKSLRRMSAVKKPKKVVNHVDMIDTILTNTFSNNLAGSKVSAAEEAPGQKMTVNTRRTASMNLAKVFEPSPTPATIGAQNELFVRRNKEEKVKKLLEMKRKKEERQKEKKMKRMLKKSQYVGIGQEEAPGKESSSRKFTTAQTIGGRKLVLKKTGEVVEVASKKHTQIMQPEPPSLATEAVKPSQVSQAERNLIDELIRIGESAMGDNFDLCNASNIDTSVQAQTSYTMPEFDYMQDGGTAAKDFPCLEDIF